MQSLCDHPQYQLNHLLDPKLQQQIQQQQQPPQPPQPQQQQRRPQQQQKQLQQQQQKQQQQETHQPQQPPQPQQQQQQQHQPQQQQQQQQKAHQPQHIQQTDIVKRRYKSKLRRSPMCRGTRPVITHNHHNHRHQDNNNEEQDEDDEEEEIVFDRRPSMCLLLEPETILLFRLAGMKLKPSQQERLYWNLLRLLNYLESEGKGKNVGFLVKDLFFWNYYLRVRFLSKIISRNSSTVFSLRSLLGFITVRVFFMTQVFAMLKTTRWYSNCLIRILFYSWVFKLLNSSFKMNSIGYLGYIRVLE